MYNEIKALEKLIVLDLALSSNNEEYDQALVTTLKALAALRKFC